MSDWRSKVFIWFGLPVIAVVGLGLSVQDVGPAWSAKNGGGTAGTFTVLREDCGRRNCTWHGDWVAADGSSRREDVILYDEPDGIKVGEEVEALDSGARKGVFSKAGGGTYLLVTGLALAGVAAAVALVVIIARRVARRGKPEPAAV